MKRHLEKFFARFGWGSEQSNIKPQRWLDEQKQKLENGEDIEPPWKVYNPSLSPWELRHDYWMNNIWLVFWNKMTKEEQKMYRKKWDMPDDWYEVVTMLWSPAMERR